MSIAVTAIAKCADTADAQSPHKMFWLSVSKDGQTDFVARDSMGFYAKVTPVNKAVIVDNGQDRVDLCLPFNEFKELVSHCKTDIVQLEILDEEVIVRFKGEKGKYKLRRGLVNLPEEPELKGEYVELDSDEFCNMLTCSAISTCQDMTLDFSSVQLTINKQGVVAYSTDTTRTSKYFLEEKDLYDGEFTLLLPKPAVERLKTMTFGAGVKVYLNPDALTITSGKNFIFHGPQGKNSKGFPKIIQECFELGIQASIYIDKSEFKQKLSLASILGKDSKVKIAIDGKRLLLDTKDTAGATSDEISGTLDPDFPSKNPASVNVSLKNIRDAIANIEDDEVKLQWRDTPAPVDRQGYHSFLAIQEGPWTYLLMPTQEKDEE
jgi:DNA polymerase III sliding clamp (beta) subunit (PCNA family)